MHISRERVFEEEGRACVKALGLELPVECEGGKKSGEKETREVGAKGLAPLCGQDSTLWTIQWKERLPSVSPGIPAQASTPKLLLHMIHSINRAVTSESPPCSSHTLPSPSSLSLGLEFIPSSNLLASLE